MTRSRRGDEGSPTMPEWLAEAERQVSEATSALLPVDHENPELARYYSLLREYPSRQGKGLRARLTLLSAACHGGDWRAGVTAAAAIELFQNWVLVHDDVEDDSDERRGLPTLHRQTSEALAINAGDGLHAYMWQLLLDDERLPRSVLAEFLWLVHRTAEGQHLDLAWVEQGRFDVEPNEYLEMVRLKTACYTVTSPLRLGAHVAGVAPDERLALAGEQLGIAFQIRDDVLNLTRGAPSGKEFAGDLFEGKRTLILAHFFATANSGERGRAEALLAGDRRDRTVADVEELLVLLERHGSIAHAQNHAEERAQSGLELLEGALADQSGDNSARASLLGLVRSLTTRIS